MPKHKKYKNKKPFVPRTRSKSTSDEIDNNAPIIPLAERRRGLGATFLEIDSGSEDKGADNETTTQTEPRSNSDFLSFSVSKTEKELALQRRIKRIKKLSGQPENEEEEEGKTREEDMTAEKDDVVQQKDAEMKDAENEPSQEDEQKTHHTKEKEKEKEKLAPKFTELMKFQHGLPALNFSSSATDVAEAAKITSSMFKESQSRLVEDLLKKSVLQGLEGKAQAPPLDSSRASRLIKIQESKKHREVADDVKQHLQLLQLRGILDPKRFYKKPDSKKFKIPDFFEIGTIQADASEHFRVASKKERSRLLPDQLLRDPEIKQYIKRKTREIQAKAQNRIVYKKKQARVIRKMRDARRSQH